MRPFVPPKWPYWPARIGAAASKRDLSPPSSLYRFIWYLTGRDQLLLSDLTLVLVPLAMMPLELQRRMINQAIGDAEARLLFGLAPRWSTERSRPSSLPTRSSTDSPSWATSWMRWGPWPCWAPVAGWSFTARARSAPSSVHHRLAEGGRTPGPAHAVLPHHPERHGDLRPDPHDDGRAAAIGRRRCPVAAPVLSAAAATRP
jgi:hypothetical protein